MSSAIPKPTSPKRTRRSSNAQAAKNKTATADNPQDSTGNDNHAAAPVNPAPARPAVTPGAPQDTSYSAKRLGGSRDILLSLPGEEKERMVNTVAWTGAYIGIKHNSRFIRYAIARLCAELEQKYNNGEPYGPPAEPAL